MHWKYDWFQFEARVGVGIVTLALVFYGASRVIDWFSR
jgi:hypothetical protein